MTPINEVYVGNISNAKAAGKGNPRPKSETNQITHSDVMDQFRAAVAARRREPYTPPRPLRVGDIVTISTDPKLAQITAIDGGGAVLAPLINTETDEVDDPSRRFGWQSDELRLVPAPPLPVPGAPRAPAPQMPTPVFERNYNAESEELYQLVRAALPPSNRVRVELREVEEQGYRWQCEHPEKVRAAVHCFYNNLSQAEQRRILNGWTPIPIRPTPGSIDPKCEHMHVRLAVYVYPLPNGQALSHAEWRIDECVNPTEVIIYGHSSKADVLASLKSQIMWIDENWTEITNSKPQRPGRD